MVASASLTPRLPLLAASLACLCALPVAQAAALVNDVTVGGDLALTSDYIYRGLSETGGEGAAQADVHLDTAGGTYFGVWTSSRNRHLYPYGDADLELSLGHRFDFGGSFGASIEGRSHYVLGGSAAGATDYQELTAALSYLDRFTLSVTAIPNAVHYWYYERLGRSPAWVADTSAQWLLGGGFYVTGGAGYYYASGSGPGVAAGLGYAYGNGGVAFEYRHWRLDVGYFLTQRQAQKLSPYPLANDRLAGTLSLRF
jgi:uncharacterized protein (TIGR02001 family)